MQGDPCRELEWRLNHSTIARWLISNRPMKLSFRTGSRSPPRHRKFPPALSFTAESLNGVCSLPEELDLVRQQAIRPVSRGLDTGNLKS